MLKGKKFQCYTKIDEGKNEPMILLVNKDGNVYPFTEFEFINENMLALYGEKSYVVETKEIALKLQNGVNPDCSRTLPMIYSFDAHGSLTNESFAKYGVPINTVFFADENSKEDIKLFVSSLCMKLTDSIEKGE